MPVIYQYRIYRQDLRHNPHVLYLFGDNVQRVGMGGQAREMRGEPNAIGVATKWTPGVDPSAYVFDKDYDRIVSIIEEDFKPLIKHVAEGNLAVFPSDGIGTGLALLTVNAPNVLDYIEERLAYITKL